MKTSELKTLKDLEVDCLQDSLDFGKIQRNILKQEAIKWIKLALIKVNSMSSNAKLRFIFNEVDYNILELYAVIKEKKHFFNITEEELK